MGGIGDRLSIRLDQPVTTDHISLLTHDSTTMLTEVGLRFDGGELVRVPLDASARLGLGQDIRFPEREFRELENRHPLIAALDQWVKSGGWLHAVLSDRARSRCLKGSGR